MIEQSMPVAFAIQAALVMLSAALLLAFARLLRGPSVADRVVALDLLAIIAVGLAAVYAVATGQAAYLDVAVVIALVIFVGTIAFARYLEKEARR